MVKRKNIEILISEKRIKENDSSSDDSEKSSDSGYELRIKCKKCKIIYNKENTKDDLDLKSLEQNSRVKNVKKKRKENDFDSDNPEKIPDSKYKLPNKSKKWKKDVQHFNVNLIELDLPIYSKDQFPDLYKELILEGWDKEKLLWHGDLTKLSNKCKSILDRLRHIIITGDLNINDKGVKLRGFLNSLLNKLGFNNSQSKLYLRYPYSIDIFGQSFSTVLDFMVFKDDQVIIIVENDSAAFSSFEEQIIGEIIMCGYYIAQHKMVSFKSITINAITFKGTKFAFYKAEFPFEYFYNCYNSDSKREITIKRYPKLDKSPKVSILDSCEDGKKYLLIGNSKIPVVEDFNEEKMKKYLHLSPPLKNITLDFFEEKDRLHILNLLYSLSSSTS